MLASVTQIIGTAYSNAMSFFQSVLNATGMAPIVLAAIFVILCIRFILRPVFGGAVADNAKSIRSGNKAKGTKKGG